MTLFLKASGNIARLLRKAGRVAGCAEKRSRTKTNVYPPSLTTPPALQGYDRRVFSKERLPMKIQLKHNSFQLEFRHITELEPGARSSAMGR